MTSLAERTREAARERPFLVAALRAGVVNYTAAARSLDVDGETDAVATALRRFADDLPAFETGRRTAPVTMRRGVGRVEGPAGGGEGDSEALLSVGGTAYGEGGDLTALVAGGDVDADALSAVLGRLAVADVGVEAAGVGDDALVVVVARADGPDALRLVEGALGAVPTRGRD